MKTEERKSDRPFSPVAVEALYPPPRAGFSPVPSPNWVKRMLPIVRSHLAPLATGWGATVVSQVTLLAVPFVLRNAINHLVAHRTQSVRFDITILALLALAQFASGYVSRSRMLSSAYGIEYDM